MIMTPCSIQRVHPIFVFQLRQNPVVLQQAVHNRGLTCTGCPPKRSTTYSVDVIRGQSACPLRGPQPRLGVLCAQPVIEQIHLDRSGH